MKRLLSMCLLLFALLILNSCAGTLVAPASDQASAVVVDLDYYIVNPLGMEIKKTGYWLYFVRLDEEGKVPSLSEWHRGVWKDGSWYLLNATPGYWTVAGVGYIDYGMIVDTKVVAPLPEGLVKKSKINLQPGRVAYLGTYKVVLSKEKISMDSVQQYYMKTFLAGEAKLSRHQIVDNFLLDFTKGGGVVPTTYTLIPDHGRRMDAIKKMGPAWADRVKE